jgi:hypothetical protein
MEQMNITSAKYFDNPLIKGSPDGIIATIDGITMSVPLDPQNRHYAEILKAVEDGELTIAPAES